MSQPSESKWYAVFFREHPALLASIVYVAASTIGMVYSWEFLRRFGINVFNYAQIGDFLLASLKEPFTWLLVLAAIAIMMIDNASSRRFARKERAAWLRWYGSKTYRSINYLVAIVLILLFLNVYTGKKAEEVKAGKGERVDVLLADGTRRSSALLLGTTGQFLFLFDHASGQVDIHPHENVQTITLAASVAENETSTE
ncbi:MAG: hypothetical protein R3212_03560 [Xanthomonadales bacterium]|nr:hypothetical protein [Xanthomonadales bacterium]